MKTELIRLSVGDCFKYDKNSPEFELISFIPCDDKYSRYCFARNLETGFVTRHSCFYSVFIPPYEFSKQLTLF